LIPLVFLRVGCNGVRSIEDTATPILLTTLCCLSVAENSLTALNGRDDAHVGGKGLLVALRGFLRVFSTILSWSTLEEVHTHAVVKSGTPRERFTAWRQA
jgi:hypothetical protein